MDVPAFCDVVEDYVYIKRMSNGATEDCPNCGAYHRPLR